MSKKIELSKKDYEELAENIMRKMKELRPDIGLEAVMHFASELEIQLFDDGNKNNF